jgi:hypothetical protein
MHIPFNVILPSMSQSPKYSPIMKFNNQNPECFSYFPLCPVGSVHWNLLTFDILTMLAESGISVVVHKN